MLELYITKFSLIHGMRDLKYLIPDLVLNSTELGIEIEISLTRQNILNSQINLIKQAQRGRGVNSLLHNLTTVSATEIFDFKANGSMELLLLRLEAVLERQDSIKINLTKDTSWLKIMIDVKDAKKVCFGKASWLVKNIRAKPELVFKILEYWRTEEWIEIC